MTDAESPAVDGMHIHLLMRAGQNRRMLADWLASRYEVTSSDTPGSALESSDLCIVDATTFRDTVDDLATHRARNEPAFFPVLLLAPEGAGGLDPDVWAVVDDVITAPVRQAVLHARLSNLLRQRRLSTELAERERELAETVDDLRLKERAMDAAPSGVTITDPHEPDNPTVYANEAFERLTGYDTAAVIGRNMRFLQGPASNEAEIEAMHDAIEMRESVSATLLNYREDDSQFWNRVDIAPVTDDSGALTHFVGFQTDVTDEKIREQRLSVLNRLMRHNLSNDLNIVEGYADILLDELDDPEHRAYLAQIKAASIKLERIGDDAGRIEQLLQTVRRYDSRTELGETLETVRDEFSEAHPDVEITLDVTDGPWFVTGTGFEELFGEVIENAIEHTHGRAPAIDITVATADDSRERVEVEIADDGPGLPPSVDEVLYRGEETQLKHGDGLGLWLVYWVSTLLGGDVRFTSTASGTTVTLTFPVAAERDST